MPIALSIAGSDCSGGAGIQADLKTFSAFGVYGATAIAALTAQNTRGVTGVHAVPPAFLTEQIDRIAEDLDVGAVKTGMLATADVVEAVAAAITRHREGGRLGPLVVDPVMVATSGDVLLAADAIETVCKRLIPLAELVTPNLEEAAVLTGLQLARSLADMHEQAAAIGQRFGPHAVLVKGGHGFGPTATDVLWTGGVTREYALPRLNVPPCHGTGCTLSAAITALLACGEPLESAVGRAKQYLWNAIEAARSAPVGHGAQPTDHLYAIRRSPPPA
ncbi:MAG: bifunctional hydroxymethylpyrimidine kinase/phosphomethylpyrimidine kinase [Hyphomicrobiaceae bacterium]|nr:bifunctional hydroxymethylpyrimidine kinase/phosphomethylpyrimidine kinase [Hyphomicrobiaceae bacterium]